jgi:ECF transporter S component (folate family)
MSDSGKNENKFWPMRRLTTAELTTAGLLAAIATVLGFCKIPINDLIEIRFQSLAVAVGGMLMGPGVGAAIGALADILGYLVKPTGPYFPGFTISSLISGLIFGFLLYKKPTVKRLIAAQVLNTLITSVLLNSLWLSMLYGKGFIAAMIARLPKSLVMIPINVILLTLVLKPVHKAVTVRRGLQA